MKKFSPPRAIQRLRRARIDNKGLKALSLLLAVLLFAVSRQPLTDLRLAGVPIDYRGWSRGIEISGEVAQTVGVRVSGPRDVVRTLIANQLLVIADLSGKEPGERIVQLKADESSLPESVRVLQIQPSSIRIRLEPSARKRINVSAQFEGELEPGREIYRVQLTPGEVEIKGPQSQVNKLDRVMTETVNLAGRKENFWTSVEIEPPPQSVTIAPPGPIRLSVEIGEQRLVRRFAGVPVQWPDQPANGRLLTKTVEVEIYGPKSAVEALRAGELGVEVKTAELPAGVDSVLPQVRLPATADKNLEVRNVNPKEVKLKK